MFFDITLVLLFIISFMQGHHWYETGDVMGLTNKFFRVIMLVIIGLGMCLGGASVLSIATSFSVITGENGVYTIQYDPITAKMTRK